MSTDVIRTMEEFHRLVRPGGRVRIETPHYTDFSSFCDPTHNSHLNSFSFRYFGENHGGFGYYTDAKFREISVRVKLLAFWRWLGFEFLVNRFPALPEILGVLPLLSWCAEKSMEFEFEPVGRLLYRIADRPCATGCTADLGRRGEDLAHRYLRAPGLRDRRAQLAARRRAAGEIDIIAWDGGKLVFVEVKTRVERRDLASRAGHRPEKTTSLHPHRAGLCRAAPTSDGVDVRFDVIAITGVREA